MPGVWSAAKVPLVVMPEFSYPSQQTSKPLQQTESLHTVPTSGHLNSSKGVILGTSIGFLWGDTRSLDKGSPRVVPKGLSTKYHDMGGCQNYSPFLGYPKY